MDRDELQTLIREAERKMRDTSLTDHQREAATDRYWNLVALVPTVVDKGEPEKPKEELPFTEYPPDIQKHVNDIWAKLDPEGKRRKRA